jgi:KipI family sensor histidine kinase inhibitor
MRVLPCGPSAVLAEYESLAEVLAVYEALRFADVAGVDQIVPAARTVLVQFHDVDRDRLDSLLVPSDLAPSVHGPLVEIPVVYDGEDLDEVADLTGLSRDEVINLHSSASYTVAYLGFSPGFGYLTGLDPILHVPRRAVPRTSVPAGSVAIAGPYASVYPSASPGGWRLLGHTSTVLWDVRRDPPSLLEPGTRVRFSS